MTKNFMKTENMKVNSKYVNKYCDNNVSSLTAGVKVHS